MKQLLTTLFVLLFCMSANAQDADALYEQGKALYDQADYRNAFPKLKQAADMGHKKAQYRVGRCYDKGRGVEEDNAKAFRWYSKSAAQGYYKAEYQLARCFLKGKGTTANTRKAKEWVTKAVSGRKHGAEMLQEIRDGAASGDSTDQQLLQLLGVQ